MPAKEEQRLLERALHTEAEAYELLLAGRSDRAAALLTEVSALYAASWREAHARAFGRLVGMLKAAVVAGDASAAAAEVRSELGTDADSPTAAYAISLAGLVEDDDELAERAAATMRAGGEAFERTADALAALARRDAAAYRRAVEAIVADFEQRADHLTGVAIADTAVVLERLAASRGMAVSPRSPVMPP